MVTISGWRKNRVCLQNPYFAFWLKPIPSSNHSCGRGCPVKSVAESVLTHREIQVSIKSRYVKIWEGIETYDSMFPHLTIGVDTFIPPKYVPNILTSISALKENRKQGELQSVLSHRLFVYTDTSQLPNRPRRPRCLEFELSWYLSRIVSTEERQNTPSTIYAFYSFADTRGHDPVGQGYTSTGGRSD